MTGAVLITGATSGIGSAVARRLAAEGRPLVLAGRDEDELERLAGDLRVRHDAPVETRRFEAQDFQSHPAFVESCAAAFVEGLAGVIVCHGYLGDNERAHDDPEMARAIFEINYASCAAVLERVAALLESRGGGFLCAVSSVAGDRGRQSNYLYGSAKAGLNVYMDGLRHRLARTGVSVTTVRPGFVDTGMTYGLPGLFLVADPDRVARDVLRAIRRRRRVVYTPWFWRYIMLIIRNVPAFVFHKTNL